MLWLIGHGVAGTGRPNHTHRGGPPRRHSAARKVQSTLIDVLSLARSTDGGPCGILHLASGLMHLSLRHRGRAHLMLCPCKRSFLFAPFPFRSLRLPVDLSQAIFARTLFWLRGRRPEKAGGDGGKGHARSLRQALPRRRLCRRSLRADLRCPHLALRCRGSGRHRRRPLQVLRLAAGPGPRALRLGGASLQARGDVWPLQGGLFVQHVPQHLKHITRLQPLWSIAASAVKGQGQKVAAKRMQQSLHGGGDVC
mmetsp:Transcript_66447/g.158544  ORF Transcript_66447/g.158544 Transcript_66447/m.158544 type:complete len:253 (-) Transcript_66447:457-1215(-)